MKIRILLATGFLIGSAAVAQRGGGASCDRACLEGFVDQYMDAMLAHNPKAVPLAPNVKFTENGQRLVIPDALWNSITGKGAYRLFVSDPQAGQVAFIGTIKEEARAGADALGLFALRLKIVNRQVTEAETLVVRNERAAQNVEKVGKPNPVFLESVPPSERMSREDLIKTANMYFSGMEKNDGKGDYPFTDDCNRFENGSQTTNAPTPAGQKRPDPKTSTGYSAQWSCKEQFESGLIHFVWRIRDRRYVAVDQERGLVFSFAFFDHALGKDRAFQTPDGRTVTGGPTQPWTWELAEMFKVEKGKLRQIEASSTALPTA